MQLPPFQTSDSKLQTLYRADTHRAGFSLIEIILAIGIISFALVGILGMFPVAMDAAAKSQSETQAALIARSIFNQLEATPDTPSRSIILAEKFDGTSPPSVTVDLSQSKTFPKIGFDPEGQPLASDTDPKAAYTAEVSVSPITTPAYGLSQVVVTVTPVNSKTGYPFTSILRQQ